MASEAMHSLSREKSSSASIGQPKASLQFAGSDGFREATTFRWLAERLMNPLSWKLPLGSKVPKVASMMLLAFWLMIAGVRVSVLLWRLSGIRALKQGSFQPSMELRAI